MKLCKVQGCDRIHWGGLGYCTKHYSRFKRYSDPLKSSDYSLPKYCEIKNCGKKHYAKGYCYNHYRKIIYYPEHREKLIKYQTDWDREHYIHKKHKCLVNECQNNTSKNYCVKHQYRIKHHLPLDLSIKYSAKGNRNVNWKGGVAQYPNHYLMKKNRLIILLNNPKCEKCGKPATQIHHRDFSKVNHKLSNLMAVCTQCNCKLSSKFYQRYGMTLNEIASKLGKSRNYWWKHQEELDKVLLDKVRILV